MILLDPQNASFSYKRVKFIRQETGEMHIKANWCTCLTSDLFLCTIKPFHASRYIFQFFFNCTINVDAFYMFLPGAGILLLNMV